MSAALLARRIHAVKVQMRPSYSVRGRDRGWWESECGRIGTEVSHPFAMRLLKDGAPSFRDGERADYPPTLQSPRQESVTLVSP
jgi:hypothetical protein